MNHWDELYKMDTPLMWTVALSLSISEKCNFVTLFDLPQNTNNDKTRRLHKSKWKWRGSPKRNHEAYRHWAPPA